MSTKRHHDPTVTNGREDDVPLHPRHRARNYTHSALVQLLKAEHQLDLALTRPRRHLDAALLHLELARQYANDAEQAIRGYLHDRAGTLPPVPPSPRHDG